MANPTKRSGDDSSRPDDPFRVLVQGAINSIPVPTDLITPEEFARKHWPKVTPRPFWKHPVLWVCSALGVILVVSAISVFAFWPRKLTPPPTQTNPSTGKTTWPMKPAEIKTRLDLQKYEVQPRSKGVVFNDQKFTHSTEVITDYRYGSVYLINSDGARRIYTLGRDKGGQLSGSMQGQFRKLDKNDGVEYEYFVVVVADEDHPDLQNGKSGEPAAWLKNEELLKLLLVEQSDRSLEEIRGILKAALERLDLPSSLRFETSRYSHLNQSQP